MVGRCKVLFALRLEPVESGKDGEGRPRKDLADNDRLADRRQERRQCRQSRPDRAKRPKAGGTLAVLLFTSFPPSFEPDKQADGQGDPSQERATRSDENSSHPPHGGRIAGFNKVRRTAPYTRTSFLMGQVSCVNGWAGAVTASISGTRSMRSLSAKGYPRPGWARLGGLDDNGFQPIQADQQGRSQALALDRERRQGPDGGRTRKA